jgi:Cupin domain
VEHVHPIQEERFEVLKGTLTATVAHKEPVLGPGDSQVVPPGVRHRLSNDGHEPCEVRVTVRPALYFEELLEVIYGLARDGLDEEGGPKSLLQLAPPMRGRYHNHFYLASPSVWVQKLLFAILAPVGRLFGYKSDYPEYVVSKPQGERLDLASPSR